MKTQLLSQTLRLMRQHPFYTLVSVVGTSMTIAFVMVVVMIYEFRAADIAPEQDRSRLVYTDKGRTEIAADGTNISPGMGRTAYEALFTGLPGVEDVTFHAASVKVVCSLPASHERYGSLMRSVGPNWFDFFHYEFVAGRPFTRAEYDLGLAAFRETESEYKSVELAPHAELYRKVVICETLARKLFGSAEQAVDKVLWCDFQPSTVVGVVRDVSAIFQTAYAEVFQPFTLTNEEANYRYWETGGLGGRRLGILRLAPSTSFDEVQREVERRQNQLNSQGLEFKFTMQRLYTHTDYTFFRDSSVDARLVYVLLILVLLGVPAISISGLMHAQMQSRLSEIAVRRAYGASNFSILLHFFGEGMVNTLLGGAVGYLLSCLLVWLGRLWLLGGDSRTLAAIEVDAGLLFRPSLFAGVLVVCLVFNWMSTLLPVWLALRRNIVVTLKGE